MEGDNINVLENIISAISILNKTDEYLEGLNDSLSKYDSIISDYEHFIEDAPIDKIDAVKLFNDMQKVFKARRIIKRNMAIRDNYSNLSNRLNNNANREFLIQNLKNAFSKACNEYRNRILKAEDFDALLINCTAKAKRGRPRKVVD